MTKDIIMKDIDEQPDEEHKVRSRSVPSTGAPTWNWGAPPSQHGEIFITPRSSPNTSFGGFVEASLHEHDWLNRWPLELELNRQPLSPPWRETRGQGWKFQPSNHLGGFPDNQSPTLGLFKSYLINMNSDAVERGLWVTKDISFTFIMIFKLNDGWLRTLY